MYSEHTVTFDSHANKGGYTILIQVGTQYCEVLYFNQRMVYGLYIQINLLVAKLHGPSIGLSVLGIITITKEMILTVSRIIFQSEYKKACWIFTRFKKKQLKKKFKRHSCTKKVKFILIQFFPYVYEQRADTIVSYLVYIIIKH